LQWIGIASKELEDDKIAGKREQLEGKIQDAPPSLKTRRARVSTTG
jgi:hypothetical protein